VLSFLDSRFRANDPPAADRGFDGVLGAAPLRFLFFPQDRRFVSGEVGGKGG
jgi:hypothetical protein